MESRSKVWLGRIYKWLLPVALVASISVAAVTVIDAASRGGGDVSDYIVRHLGGDGDRDYDKHGWGHTFEELAELVGTDSDGLAAALIDGQTLAQVAEANGVTVDTVIDAIVAAANERIDEKLASGDITDVEAAELRDGLTEKATERVNATYEGKRWGGKRVHVRGWLNGAATDLAELVGTDSDGLKAALQEGQTLAEIAEANGVAADAVVESLVASANERIEAAVESGRLTAEEAAEKQSELEEKVAERINNPSESKRGWGGKRWFRR